MNILVSAYSCEPHQGSERGVGWNLVKAIAKEHKVWVLTRPDESKAAIEAELARHPIPNLTFVYFTLPFWQNSLKLGQSGAMQLHYYLWQIQAYWVGRKLQQQIGFDIVHHVTFVRYSCPSFLSLLPAPFVWGPVGGAESAPIAFWKDFSWKSKCYETARLLWRWVGEIDPFTRLTARNSALAYAVTNETKQRLEALGAANIALLPAIALQEDEIEQLSHHQPDDCLPLRFLSIGRLLHWKGFHLGLEAFARAELSDAEYWVIGDGPERKRLEALAQSLGITHQIKFWGEQPRQSVLEAIGRCRALVHPSLHDSGAGVCLEAMAAARPVICLDLGGPAHQVTERTGLKVAAHSPEQTIRELADAMQQLASDDKLCSALGRNAQTRIRDAYSWVTRGEQLNAAYRTLAEPTVRRAERPKAQKLKAQNLVAQNLTAQKLTAQKTNSSKS